MLIDIFKQRNDGEKNLENWSALLANLLWRLLDLRQTVARVLRHTVQGVRKACTPTSFLNKLYYNVRQ